MNPYQTLAVTVRLLAIWFAVYSTSNIATMLLYGAPHNPNMMWAILIPLGILFLICTLLWIFPLFIAKKILPAEAVSTERPVTFDHWFNVGCSVIGVWLLAEAIPGIAGYFVSVYVSGYTLHDINAQDPRWALRIYLYLFKLVIGIWLFLGGKGLRKILAWARS